MYVVYKLTDDEPVFYGWTKSKAVIKVFRKQRAMNRYFVRKITRDEVVNAYNESPDNETMIDYVDLTLKATGEKIKFFTTKAELCEIEKHIQRYFRKLCVLSERPNASVSTVETYLKLDNYYLAVLEFIGFIPPDVEAIYDSVAYRENSTPEDYVEEEIDEAYMADVHPSDDDPYPHNGKLLGLTKLSQVHTQILYSVESFVKVMRNLL